MLVSSCNTTNAGQSNTDKQHSKQLLQFMKTPCYGPCPAYQADIMDDGSVVFVSWGNIAQVADDDTLMLRLNKQELKELKADIKALNYTSFQETYLSDWTDRPTSYLTFYTDGKSVKRIKHQEGGPEALTNFQKKLDQTIISLVKRSTQNTNN